jgi:PAS domain-containing protein
MKTFNVAIVGGGPGCLAIIDMISRDRFHQLHMNLLGIADIDRAAPAMEKARLLGVHTTQDYRDLFRLKDLDLVIELTGNPQVSEAIQREKPSKVQLMDHIVARLFWDFLHLEDEKRAVEKAGEDITARKKLELDLERSRKKYRNLFHNAREGLAFFDDTGKILEVNFTLAHMLGYAIDQLETMRISDFALHFSKSILQDHLEGLIPFLIQ